VYTPKRRARLCQALFHATSCHLRAHKLPHNHLTALALLHPHLPPSHTQTTTHIKHTRGHEWRHRSPCDHLATHTYTRILACVQKWRRLLMEAQAHMLARARAHANTHGHPCTTTLTPRRRCRPCCVAASLTAGRRLVYSGSCPCESALPRA